VRLRRSLVLAAGCALAAAPAAHASNDALATPTALTYGTAQQVDTSNYTVEAGEQNTTTFPQQCDSDHPVGAGRTAWYTVTGTGGPVTVSTQGSAIDTALFVYTGSPSGALVGCSDDAQGGIQSLVSFDSVQGTTYAIQVGTACNANGPPPCNQPPDGGPVNILASGTPPSGSSPAPPSGGSPAGPPSSGSPSPGGGAPTALPALKASAALTTALAKGRTLIRSLRVSGAPAGSSIAVSCSPKKKSGCPFTAKKLAVKSGKPVSLSSLFEKSKLKAGTVVTLRITKPGFRGLVITYRMRAHKSPSRTVATS
jgi:hypothetical protein